VNGLGIDRHGVAVEGRAAWTPFGGGIERCVVQGDARVTRDAPDQTAKRPRRRRCIERKAGIASS
jgi:hypothetical protein